MLAFIEHNVPTCFTSPCSLVSFFSAHDNDVKEANKSKSSPSASQSLQLQAHVPTSPPPPLCKGSPPPAPAAAPPGQQLPAALPALAGVIPAAHAGRLPCPGTGGLSGISAAPPGWSAFGLDAGQLFRIFPHLGIRAARLAPPRSHLHAGEHGARAPLPRSDLRERLLEFPPHVTAGCFDRWRQEREDKLNLGLPPSSALSAAPEGLSLGRRQRLSKQKTNSRVDPTEVIVLTWELSFF